MPSERDHSTLNGATYLIALTTIVRDMTSFQDWLLEQDQDLSVPVPEIVEALARIMTNSALVFDLSTTEWKHVLQNLNDIPKSN